MLIAETTEHHQWHQWLGPQYFEQHTRCFCCVFVRWLVVTHISQAAHLGTPECSAGIVLIIAMFLSLSLIKEDTPCMCVCCPWVSHSGGFPLLVVMWASLD